MSEIHHFTVGHFDCIVVQDATGAVLPDFAFQQVPEDERNAALRAAGYDPAAPIAVSWACLAVETGAGASFFRIDRRFSFTTG